MEMRGHGGITTEPQIISVFETIIKDRMQLLQMQQAYFNKYSNNIPSLNVFCNLNTRNKFQVFPTDKFGHNPSYIAENYMLQTAFRLVRVPSSKIIKRIFRRAGLSQIFKIQSTCIMNLVKLSKKK